MLVTGRNQLLYALLALRHNTLCLALDLFTHMVLSSRYPSRVSGSLSYWKVSCVA